MDLILGPINAKLESNQIYLNIKIIYRIVYSQKTISTKD